MEGNETKKVREAFGGLGKVLDQSFGGLGEVPDQRALVARPDSLCLGDSVSLSLMAFKRKYFLENMPSALTIAMEHESFRRFLFGLIFGEVVEADAVA
ncbi:hypothetical protein E4U55_003220 [Claviceps digitariae]|nr:hypothetical protein E4U55_003220 [Claviceps digitariae]